MNRVRLAFVTALSLIYFLNIAVQAGEIHNIGAGSAPDIASDADGNLSIVFESYENGSKIPDIYYKRSADNGLTWSDAKNISHAPGISSHPSVATEKDGTIDVVWSDTTSSAAHPDIYFARSKDSGKTWTLPKDISNTAGESTEPALATGPDNSVHVVWCDTRKGEENKEIYYCSSSDGGENWSAPSDISNTVGVSSIPTVTVNEEGQVHCAWVDNTSGEKRPDIYYARKMHGAWSKPIDVCSTARNSAHPAIACGKSTVYICWSDNSEQQKAADIWLACSDPELQFKKPVNISSTIGVSSEPDMAVDSSGRVAVVWQDSSPGVEKPDIYARFSLDQAKTFSNVFDIANTTGISLHPDVTIAGNSLFVVWEELDGTELQLMVSRNELKKTVAAPAAEVDVPSHSVPSVPNQ
jgi:hypothetical protein